MIQCIQAALEFNLVKVMSSYSRWNLDLNMETGHHLGSGHSTGNDPLSSSTHPTSGTSGLRDTTGKNPLSTSTNPTGSSQYDTTSSGRGTHGLNEPYASRMPGGFDDDAATTASVRSGVPGKGTHTGSGTTGVYDPNITNKPLPNEPTAAGARLPGSSYNNSGAGNSLTGNNYPDRSVDRQVILHPLRSSLLTLR